MRTQRLTYILRLVPQGAAAIDTEYDDEGLDFDAPTDLVFLTTQHALGAGKEEVEVQREGFPTGHAAHARMLGMIGR